MYQNEAFATRKQPNCRLLNFLTRHLTNSMVNHGFTATERYCYSIYFTLSSLIGNTKGAGMSYSDIIWQQDWTKLQGFIVKSPFSGQIMPLNEHPLPLYAQDILKNTLACRLQQGTLYAPFNAQLSTSRDVNRRLVFKHQSGLTLTLDLPVSLRNLNGKGMHWLSHSGMQVAAGKPVLQLDLPYLQIQLDDIYCLATITGSARLDKIYSRRAQVNANTDAIFVLQLKSSDTDPSHRAVSTA